MKEGGKTKLASDAELAGRLWEWTESQRSNLKREDVSQDREERRFVVKSPIRQFEIIAAMWGLCAK
jgi:hypothetical protein